MQSGFVNGEVIIAVRPTLPIDNIDMIIGNNLGGDCVWPEKSCPPPVVKSVVTASVEPEKSCRFPRSVHCLRCDASDGSCSDSEAV